MSTVYSPSPTALGLSPASPAAARRSGSGARHLAAVLLAAAVAALVVLADRLIESWADEHLFLGWVALWLLVFAGLALFAGPAGRLARRTLDALDRGARTLAEARAQARLWEMARRDPRLKAELLLAQASAQAAPAPVPTAAAHDYREALAPLGLETASTATAPQRSSAALARPRHYLPYL